MAGAIVASLVVPGMVEAAQGAELVEEDERALAAALVAIAAVVAVELSSADAAAAARELAREAEQGGNAGLRAVVRRAITSGDDDRSLPGLRRFADATVSQRLAHLQQQIRKTSDAQPGSSPQKPIEGPWPTAFHVDLLIGLALVVVGIAERSRASDVAMLIEQGAF